MPLQKEKERMLCMCACQRFTARMHAGVLCYWIFYGLWSGQTHIWSSETHKAKIATGTTWYFSIRVQPYCNIFSLPLQTAIPSQHRKSQLHGGCHHLIRCSRTSQWWRWFQQRRQMQQLGWRSRVPPQPTHKYYDFGLNFLSMHLFHTFISSVLSPVRS